MIALLLALSLDEPVATSAPTGTIVPAAEAQREAPAQPGIVLPKKRSEPARALRLVWKDRPSLRAGKDFRLDVTAKLQYDGRQPGDAPAAFPTWEVQKLRFGVDGEIFKHIQYQIERETKSSASTNATKSPWKDVYVETDYASNAQIRVGKFKVPFGLDQQAGDSKLDMVHRSLGGDYLAPGRDWGAMVHGRFFKRGLNYWVGGFRQDGENSRSAKIVGGDTTFVGRVTVRPFRKISKVLGEAEVGTAYAQTDVSDASFLPNGLRGRTVMSQYTFFESVFVKGQRRRFGVDVEWTVGPLAAQAEFLEVDDGREGQSLGNDTLTNARARSWFIAGAWVLTGEKKSGGVVPRRNLLMGGPGAFELVGRFDQLRFDSEKGQDPPFRNSRAATIFPSGDTVATVGLNWYLNPWAKLQVNAIRERTSDPERSPTADGAAFWSKVFRLQLEL